MIAIRSATPDDVASVVDLWNRAAGPTRRAGQIPEASALWARDPDALIVADDDGAIVGTLIVGWDGWRFHLYRLAVDPAARRSGVASRLVAEARARAAALDVFRIDAMVDGDNEGAHGFWASVGFDVEADCRHPASLARFWAAVLVGYDVAPYDAELRGSERPALMTLRTTRACWSRLLGSLRGSSSSAWMSPRW